MGRFIDLTGQVFGRWTILEKSDERSSNGNVLWKCKCECGTIKLVVRDSLKNGKSQSCGCLNSEKRTKHGDYGSRFLKIYDSIKQRCLNTNDINYVNYGGRGIKVCDRWLEPDSKGYLNFKEDMYGSYLKHIEEFGENNTTIDRIDNNGNYKLSNIRWATRQEQAENTRHIYWFKATRLKDNYIEYSKNQSEFARKYNLNQGCISNCLNDVARIHKGWVFECIEEWTYRILSDSEVKEFIAELV